jgi:hypothetical protein
MIMPLRPFGGPFFAALLSFVAACEDGPSSIIDVAVPTEAEDALVGIDGDLTLPAGDTTLNEYAALSANAGVGATTLTVADITQLASGRFGDLAPDDLLLVYQARGATIDTGNDADYGTVTALGSAGRYELVTVGSVAGNVITLRAPCALRFAYTTAGRAQVVRVPRIGTLTIPTGARLTGRDWDGARGGVVAVQATRTLRLDGSIDATGIGFRGGLTGDDDVDDGRNDFRSGNDANGGEKGEGIAGDVTTYDGLNGRFARGAPANGGGGGTAHNGGGGGGANGENGAAYTGHGVMNPTVTGAAAWALDPAVTNGALQASSGGGRGGYTFSNSDEDALTVPPGDGDWEDHA